MRVMLTRITYETQEPLLGNLKELKIEMSILRLVRQMILQCSSNELDTVIDLNPLKLLIRKLNDDDRLDADDPSERYRHERRDC